MWRRKTFPPHTLRAHAPSKQQNQKTNTTHARAVDRGRYAMCRLRPALDDRTSMTSMQRAS